MEEILTCSSCTENNPTARIKAIATCEDCSDTLCDDCVDAHRRTKLTRNHNIVRLKDSTISAKTALYEVGATKVTSTNVNQATIDNRQPNHSLLNANLLLQSSGLSAFNSSSMRSSPLLSGKLISTQSSTALNGVEVCKKLNHVNQVLKSACLNCKEAFCVVCLREIKSEKVQKHSNHKIVDIEEAIKNIRKEVQEINNFIQIAADSCSTQINTFSEDERTVKEKCESVRQETKSYCEKLCKYVKNSSLSIEEDIKKMQKEELDKIKARQNETTKAIDTSRESLTESITALNQTNEIFDLFKLLRRTYSFKNIVENCKIATSNIEKQLNIEFIPSIDFDNKEETRNSLFPLVGTLRNSSNMDLEKPPIALLDFDVNADVTPSNISVNVTNLYSIPQKHNIEVSALTCGQDNEFLVVDKKTSSILVYDKSFHFRRKITCFQQVVDIDVLPDSNLVVTEGKKGHCISVCTITGELLAGDIAAQELDDATGLAVCGTTGNVAVSDQEAAKVHIVRLLDGQRIMTFHRTDGGFQMPDFVACSPDGTLLAVSDRKGYCVKVFNVANGKLIFRYGKREGLSEMKAPEGICFDDDNRLYICDVGNSRVLVISKSGQLIGFILTKHLQIQNFQPPPNVIVLRKDKSIVLTNSKGLIRVIQCVFN